MIEMYNNDMMTLLKKGANQGGNTPFLRLEVVFSVDSYD
jgi:hypothetical protein